jgi:hypothetical protein
MKDLKMKLEFEKQATDDDVHGRRAAFCERNCFHCGGTKKCACITCSKTKDGACVICSPSERLAEARKMVRWEPPPLPPGGGQYSAAQRQSHLTDEFLK